jgi:hypothetical protein
MLTPLLRCFSFCAQRWRGVGTASAHGAPSAPGTPSQSRPASPALCFAAAAPPAAVAAQLQALQAAQAAQAAHATRFAPPMVGAAKSLLPSCAAATGMPRRGLADMTNARFR